MAFRPVFSRGSSGGFWKVDWRTMSVVGMLHGQAGGAVRAEAAVLEGSKGRDSRSVATKLKRSSLVQLT